MTPSEQQLWFRIQRRASSVSPELAGKILRAFKAISNSYSEQALAKMIAERGADAVVEKFFSDAVLNVAYAPVQIGRASCRERV